MPNSLFVFYFRILRRRLSALIRSEIVYESPKINLKRTNAVAVPRASCHRTSSGVIPLPPYWELSVYCQGSFSAMAVTTFAVFGSSSIRFPSESCACIFCSCRQSWTRGSLFDRRVVACSSTCSSNCPPVSNRFRGSDIHPNESHADCDGIQQVQVVL